MNKLIIIPLFIMILIAMFAINIELTENPETGDTDYGLGSVVIEGDKLAWYYENEKVGYFVSSKDLKSTIDPRKNPDAQFVLRHGDRSYTTYDDLNDFNNAWDVNLTEPKDVIVNLMDTNVLWGAIVLILGSGVAFGVSVIGSGLSEFAQRALFVSLLYGTFWAFLSITTYDVLMNGVLDIFGTLIYFMLTITYIIGMGVEVTAGD